MITIPRTAFKLIDYSRLGWMDFLRLLAVSMVIGRHVLDGPIASAYRGDLTGLPALLADAAGFGWSGVSLFFIISGYIVGGPVWERISAGRFRYTDFLIDRALRILPAAITVLLLAAYVSHGGGVRNYLIALLTSNYMGGAIDHTGHYWSLNVEQHFYLLAPAVMALLIPLRLPRWTVLAAIGVYAAVRLIVSLEPSGPFNPYTASHWQVDYFAFGMLLYLGRHRLKSSAWPVAVAALAIYVLYAAAVANLNASAIDNQKPYLIGASMLLALVSSAVLFMAASGGNQALQAAFSHPAVRLLGVLSYSMYLLHPLVIAASRGLLTSIDAELHGLPAANFLAMLLVEFLLTVLASLILHVAVEKPGLWLRDVRRAARRAPRALC